jgi:hypothetical protein
LSIGADFIRSAPTRSSSVLLEEHPDQIDPELILALAGPIVTTIPRTVYDLGAGGAARSLTAQG